MFDYQDKPPIKYEKGMKLSDYEEYVKRWKLETLLEQKTLFQRLKEKFKRKLW